MSPDWVFALKYPNLSWIIGTVNDAMADNPQESSEELAYVAEVKSHRTALVERFGVNWSEKDKVVVSVSSLAFGFSIGFLNPDAGIAGLLVGAWIAFGLSIIVVVYSYDLNGAQLKRSIARIDRWVESHEPGTKPKDGTYFIKGRRVLDGINSVSAYSLIVGIVLTVLFVGGTV